MKRHTSPQRRYVSCTFSLLSSTKLSMPHKSTWFDDYNSLSKFLKKISNICSYPQCSILWRVFSNLSDTLETSSESHVNDQSWKTTGQGGKTYVIIKSKIWKLSVPHCEFSKKIRHIVKSKEKKQNRLRTKLKILKF